MDFAQQRRFIMTVRRRGTVSGHMVHDRLELEHPDVIAFIQGNDEREHAIRVRLFRVGTFASYHNVFSMRIEEDTVAAGHIQATVIAIERIPAGIGQGDND